MKKQALSLFLAGALALSLFGCSAQPAAESAPQSSPAETAGSPPAGVVGAHLERCAITPL